MRPAVVLSIVLSFAAPALGDVIHQPGGGKIIGEIVEEKEDYVKIKTRGGGVLIIVRDEIDRIERGPVPESEKMPVAPAPAPAVPPAPGGATPLKPIGPATGRLGGSPSGQPITFGVDEEVAGKKAARELLGWFDAHRSGIPPALETLLRERRKAAFDFIMDPTKYPEANHGAEAQPEVDRLVKELLRPVYEDPFRVLIEQNPKAKALFEAADEAGTAGSVRDKINKAFGFADPLPSDPAPFLDPEERACIDATNRYRHMFGLRILRVDERLVKAARKHSKSMVELDFFDHTSPVPGMETPEKRVSAEGASYSAENIAFGLNSGEGTFDQWYNSSGHHRNMLGEHLTIGVGKHATHWTQNFGKDNLKAANSTR